MREFIVLMAFLTSLAALSVDAMLPALEQIGVDLEVARANSVQLVITVLFAGMMAGYLIYGPVADAWGRTGSKMRPRRMRSRNVCCASLDLNTLPSL